MTPEQAALRYVEALRVMLVAQRRRNAHRCEIQEPGDPEVGLAPVSPCWAIIMESVKAEEPLPDWFEEPCPACVARNEDHWEYIEARRVMLLRKRTLMRIVERGTP